MNPPKNPVPRTDPNRNKAWVAATQYWDQLKASGVVHQLPVPSALAIGSFVEGYMAALALPQAAPSPSEGDRLHARAIALLKERTSVQQQLRPLAERIAVIESELRIIDRQLSPDIYP